MSFKIPGNPSPQAYKEELADFWEIQALQTPGYAVSKKDIIRVLSIGSDETEIEGIEDFSDRLSMRLDDVLIELQRRPTFSKNEYPFKFNKNSIEISPTLSLNEYLYLFMLLCTRLNMKDKKIQANMDGTLLFEELCCIAARNYIGQSAKSYIIGTANKGAFEDKVNELIDQLGEGKGFKNPNLNRPRKQDGGIDVVAWRDFADERIGKLIAFAQCKTGTNWQNEISQLKPDKFCTDWFYEPPIFTPLPFFFVSDTLNEDLNFSTCQRGYLLFNRFRIMEYTSKSEEQIYSSIRKWTEEACNQIK